MQVASLLALSRRIVSNLLLGPNLRLRKGSRRFGLESARVGGGLLEEVVDVGVAVTNGGSFGGGVVSEDRLCAVLEDRFDVLRLVLGVNALDDEVLCEIEESQSGSETRERADAPRPSFLFPALKIFSSQVPWTRSLKTRTWRRRRWVSECAGEKGKEMDERA